MPSDLNFIRDGYNTLDNEVIYNINFLSVLALKRSCVPLLAVFLGIICTSVIGLSNAIFLTAFYKKYFSVPVKSGEGAVTLREQI